MELLAGRREAAVARSHFTTAPVGVAVVVPVACENVVLVQKFTQYSVSQLLWNEKQVCLFDFLGWLQSIVCHIRCGWLTLALTNNSRVGVGSLTLVSLKFCICFDCVEV